MFRKGLYYAITLLFVVFLGGGGMLGGSGNNASAQDNVGPLAAGVYGLDDPELLIITPQVFSTALVPLVDHKNNTGMPTLMITLEEIYAIYGGLDEPEKVKNAIAHYDGAGNIEYVMLVGDCNKFPVRWQLGHFNDHLLGDDDDPANDDKIYCASDYYYADLYDDYGTFNDWDANVNGHYGEIYKDDLNSDNINHIPDAAVARVPAGDITQVETYVNKVITYELNAYETEWSKRLLLIQKGWTEDIGAKESIAANLAPLGFEAIRLYEEIDPMDYAGPIDGRPNSFCINQELTRGAGFVSELYHGSYDSWDYLYDTNNVVNELYNYPRYPVIYSGACDTATFYEANIPYRSYVGVDGVTYGPVPIGSVGDTVFTQPNPIQQPYGNKMAISEAFLVATDHGAIAYYGCVSTGETDLHKFLDESFFEAYSLGHNILGDMWRYAVEDFVQHFNLHALAADGTWVPVCKMHTPSRFILLGDPSLRVGGINRHLHPHGCEWSQLFLDNSIAYSIAATDSGYVVAGTQRPSEPGPGLDIWAAMAELDLSGNIVDWATFESESKHNAAYSVIPRYTSGDVLEGYTITGYKYKFYEEDGHEYDQPDVWLMTTNTTLDKQWDERYGQPCTDWGNSIIQDGSGYVIGGWRDPCGSGTGYLVRTHEDGSLDWEAILDVADTTTWWLADEIYSVDTTLDGGYILGTEGGVVKVDSSSPPNEVWTSGEGCYYSVKRTDDGGYIGTGKAPGLPESTDVILTKLNASGGVEWIQTFGGTEPVLGASGYYDVGRDVTQTSDGGYVVVGYTESYAYHGGQDVWVIKTGASGVKEWDLALGGSGNDIGYSVVEAPDGGYVVAGSASVQGSTRMWVFKVTGGYQPPAPSFTYSPPGPVFVSKTVGFNASNTTDPDGTIINYEWDFGDGDIGGGMLAQHAYSAPGSYMVTLYVTDNDGVVRQTSQQVEVINIAVQWQKKLGGEKADGGNSIIEAVDGGYIIAGFTYSYALYGVYTDADAWLIKIDGQGDVVWDKVITNLERRQDLIQTASSVARTHDGNYIFVGYTEVNDALSGSTDRTDLWLVSVNATTSEPLWYKTIGGVYDQLGNHIVPTSDGGYIITGQTEPEADKGCLWLVKIDAIGNVEWDEYIEHPTDSDFIGDWVSPTSDHGYVATGLYSSFTDLVPLISTDNLGVERWTSEWTSSGPYASGAWVCEALDGGYVVAGSWDRRVGLMKVDYNGTKVWSQTYGTGWLDSGHAAAQTSDGGYIITGGTRSQQGYRDDIYVVKTDSRGNMEWDMSFGEGSEYSSEHGSGVLPLADGSYIILGYTIQNRGDIWLIKLGANHPPVADFTYSPPNPLPGEVITFDASASNDMDGNIVTYEWDFGTGDTGIGKIISYAFPSTDIYEVTLTVVDDQGGIGTISKTVIVAPALSVDFYAEPVVGEAPLTVDFYSTVVGGIPPYEYAWDLDNDGTIDDTGDNPSWTYNEPGVYTVTLQATDDALQSKTDTKIDYIVVTGITASDPDITITTAAISDDPGSDPTYTTGAPDDIDWETAYGFVLEATGPEDGTYAFRITFPTPLTPGFVLYKLPGWSVTPYTIIDSYTIEVELDIIDGEVDPPFVLADLLTIVVAVDDAYNMDEDATLNVPAPGVLGNDIDVDGNTVAILVDDVSHGTLTLSPDGSFTYTPQADYNGTDNFTYKANNDVADSNIATANITINPVNDPPNTPVNASPPNGATWISLTPDLEASAFSHPDNDIHIASRWQITTTPGDYSIPAFDSGTDSSNLTSIVIPGGILDYGTTYYWRVSYQDSRSVWSEWSEETRFFTEPETVLPGDANGDGFINVLDMTKVARIILQMDPLNPAADCNQDTSINVLDMTCIARKILGLD